MAITTNVVWGRNFTPDESAEFNIELAADVEAGLTDGTHTGDNTTGVIRTWTTLEAAQDWIDWCNGHTPAPTSAVINS